MITQRFESTKDFMKEWNNSVYFRLNKILCGFKDQVRACPSGEKCGLVDVSPFGRDYTQVYLCDLCASVVKKIYLKSTVIPAEHVSFRIEELDVGA